MGPEIAAHAQPRSLRDGVLVVTADQPAWATQLRYLAPDLLARVRAEAAAAEITEIQIRVAAPGPARGWDAGRVRSASRVARPVAGSHRLGPVEVTPLW